MYYVYMLRCIDNSIYTGITTDIKRRMEEHFSQNEKCAKYTMSHEAKKVECVWETENKKLASKLEYHIKHISKEKKERLVKNKSLAEVFSSKIEVEKYKVKGD